MLYVSAYTCADTFFVSSTESYTKSSSEADQSWSCPIQAVDPCINLKEVLLLWNPNFFSRSVSYGSHLLNLILGIRIGIGGVAVSVKTQLALPI